MPDDARDPEVPADRGRRHSTAGARRKGPSFRWIWASVFLAFVVVGTLWNVAQPPFAGADEYSHFVEAEAVWSGQLIPAIDRHTSSQVSTGVLHDVTVPVHKFSCFIGKAYVSAGCADGTAFVKAKVDHSDYVSREPPIPALLTGLPVALDPDRLGLYLGRFLDTLLGAACFATAIALAGVRRRPFLLLGAVLASTPSVVAAFGVLGSSQMEIGTATIVWTGVALLLDGERPTRRLVLLTAVAASLLVISRPISLVYLGLAALALLVGSPRVRLAELARAPAARISAAVIGMLSVAAVIWAAAVEAPPAAGHLAQYDLPVLVGLGAKINFYLSTVQNHWVQAIGATGDNEYNGPWWMTLTWTMLIGLTAGAGLLFAAWRRVVVVLGLIAALVVVPLVIEVAEANTERLQLQGRYDLPTLAGIILLSCSRLDFVLPRFPELRRLAMAGIGIAGACQVAEFVATLRRYAVGLGGGLDPRSWELGWHPPLPMLVLLALGVVAVAAAYTVLGAHQRSALVRRGANGVDRAAALPASPRSGQAGDTSPDL